VSSNLPAPTTHLNDLAKSLFSCATPAATRYDAASFRLGARFRHLDPPYSIFEPDEAKEHNTKNRKVVAASASTYGYELVNGVPRWNNGGLREQGTKTLPWLSEGVSHATWYRRQHRETRETPNSI
jgi:hypothetical protein